MCYHHLEMIQFRAFNFSQLFQQMQPLPETNYIAFEANIIHMYA